MKTSLVITSISPPTQVLKRYAKEAAKYQTDFFLIGDKASPANFSLENCQFYSPEDQQKLRYKLAENLPFRHYARKNLGYLLAIEQGAQIILETDDDNIPYPNFWNEKTAENLVLNIENAGWTNVYSYFSDANIWPRGFALRHVQKPLIPREELPKKTVECPIQQGLANQNPDVDAIFRLAMHLPQNFRHNESIALSSNTWCPFNSQNTTWFAQAFPLLYLPSHCSFRMTDIWRSFVAQRIAWTCGWSVLFHAPSVYQERNQHDILKDFRQEIDGYLNNETIAAELEKLPLKAGKEHIFDNLKACYALLIERGWVGEKEMPLITAWCDDLKALGY